MKTIAAFAVMLTLSTLLLAVQPVKKGAKARRLRTAAIPRWNVTPTAAPAIPNGVRLTGTDSADSTGQPVTLGRMFVLGEFPASVAAAQGETVLPTQCDVKTRWPDGSVQFAVLTFQVAIPGRSTVDISFVPADNPEQTAPLSAEAMLSEDFDLGARMELSADDTTRSVNVRDQIAAGRFRYWLQGPLCTQIIVEEQAETPESDLEFNGYKSFHPIFVLTFYPGTRGVKVEFIGENAWLSRLQDLQYSLALYTGTSADAQPVFQKKDYTQLAATRWRKVFWSGTPVPQPIVDHNLPYLIASHALPNYDLSRGLNSGSLSSMLAAYNRTDKGELGGNCLFTKNFPSTGGRGELGVFTAWDTMHLYTFSAETTQMSESCSTVSAHVPIHFRESTAGRSYASASPGTDALGRPVSVDARPGFCISPECSDGQDYPQGVRPISTYKTNGWLPDVAHQGSFAYLQYLFTGDPFWLEEMYFWTSWNIGQQPAGDCFYCRGQEEVDGALRVYGIFHPCQNCRAFGWMIRTLGHTAMMAPDGSPEKAYFTDKLLNTIAVHEGRLNVTNGFVSTDPTRQSIWNFGRNVVDSSRSNPLAIWCISGNGNVDPGDNFNDSKKTFYAIAPWMQHIVLLNLGYIEDMGFPATALRKRLYEFMLGEITDPGYNPYLVAGYYVPASPSEDVYFQNWTDILNGMKPGTGNAQRDMPGFVNSTDTDFGYNYIALATAAYLGDVEKDGRSGADAYAWLQSKIPNQDRFANSPKWAIVPRNLPVAGSLTAPSSWNGRFKRFAPRASAAVK